MTTELYRRTNAQKREAVFRALRQRPDRSNRAIARECGTDEGTVRKIRKKLEANAEIPHCGRRMTLDGRLFPAERILRKPKHASKSAMLEVRKKLFAMAKTPGIGRLLAPSIQLLTREIKRTPESDRAAILNAIREGATTFPDLVEELRWFHPDELRECLRQMTAEKLIRLNEVEVLPKQILRMYEVRG